MGTFFSAPLNCIALWATGNLNKYSLNNFVNLSQVNAQMKLEFIHFMFVGKSMHYKLFSFECCAQLQSMEILFPVNGVQRNCQ